MRGAPVVVIEVSSPEVTGITGEPAPAGTRRDEALRNRPNGAPAACLEQRQGGDMTSTTLFCLRLARARWLRFFVEPQLRARPTPHLDSEVGPGGREETCQNKKVGPPFRLDRNGKA